ncbi:MAG: polysaccharide biosynthesis protein, partial [Ruthenibacterium sp.]
IEDLAKGVQKLFGDTGLRVIGTRHGEKLYETLMTKEERLKATDMGHYYRVSADGRDLNYDKFFVDGQVLTQSEEAYTSHNTKRLDVEGVVAKLLTNDFVQEELAKNGK